MEWPCLVKPRFANADEALFFTVQMLLKGFMHSDIGFDPTVAHTPEIRQLFYTAADEVFDKMAAAKKAGTLHDQLITVEREKKKGFGRLNH